MPQVMWVSINCTRRVRSFISKLRLSERLVFFSTFLYDGVADIGVI
jgi:hypothetical protein